MRYILSKEFIKINETTGIVQNTSNGCTLEISNKNEPNSGFLIYPLQQCAFKNMKVYLRCLEGHAMANVITFAISSGGASVSPAESDDFIDDLNDLFNS